VQDLLIVVHTAAGVTALVAGVVFVLHSDRARARSRVVTTYFCGLVLSGTTGAVVLWDWPNLGGGERTAFTALIVLAAVMVVRADRARRAMILARRGWQTAFVDGIGFTLISLFDGFLVVTALDLGAPAWLVAAAGVAGVIVGRRASTALESAR